MQPTAPLGNTMGTPTTQGTTIGTAITQGASGPPGSRLFTLDQVVALAVDNNSNVQLARQRLQRAQQDIVQVDAEARPQVSADVIDTYSSQDTSSTSGVTVESPALPGGGSIPVITDTGGGSTGSFSGGGGGGTTNSTGAVSSTLGGNTSTGTTGTTTGNTGTSTTGTGTGTTTGTGGAGTGGAGTGGAGTGGAGTGGAGTGGAGTGGTGTSGAGVGAMAMAAGLPPIMQQYAKATQTGVQTSQISAKKPAAQTQPNATTTTGTTGGTFSNGQRNNYSGRISVTQYIDLFGLIPAARDVETITRDFYSLDLARVQNETALNAKDYFFIVLRDQEIVNVDQEQVNDANANVRITQAQYTNGTAAQFDVLTAQVTLANDQQALEAAQNQLNIDRANLNNLLGIDANTQISLQAPPLPPLNQAIDLNRSTQVAFQQRPELRQAENNITIAKKLVKLAGSTLQPTLGVGASANYSGPSSVNGSQSSFNLSAELNIPLYDGGTTHSKVRQAQIDLQTQLTTQGQLQENVVVEVRQAYLNVSTAQYQTSTAGVGVSQAEEAVRLAQVRYQNGLGTFLDVLNAQAQLATARNNLATAQYNYQTSLAQLTRAEGGR
jgi:outer membrane protein